MGKVWKVYVKGYGLSYETKTKNIAKTLQKLQANENVCETYVMPPNLGAWFLLYKEDIPKLLEAEQLRTTYRLEHPSFRSAVAIGWAVLHINQ
jgi:hypothetical protein